MGGHHSDLGADPALGEFLFGGLHRLHVALRAHHDPDDGGVDVEVLELDCRLRVGPSSHGLLAHLATALRAMSRLIWLPENSIMSAAAYAADRAAAAS